MFERPPETVESSERIVRWIDGLPDARLALYMLLLAIMIAVSIYFVDSRLL